MQLELLEILDHADERITRPLLDEAVGIEPYHGSTDGVAFVAANAKRKPTLGILTDFDDDDRVRDVLGVGSREGEVESIPIAIVLDDVAHSGTFGVDRECLKHADTVVRVLDRLMDEDGMRHREFELRLRRPGVLDAPGHEHGGPGDLRAAAEWKADVDGPLLDLFAEGRIGLVDELKFRVLLLGSRCETGGECAGHGESPRWASHHADGEERRADGRLPLGRPRPQDSALDPEFS